MGQAYSSTNVSVSEHAVPHALLAAGGHEVRNFGFATAVVCARNAPDAEGGKAKQYLDT